MNISMVNIKLTGDDLLSILNDFIKVDGLIISKVTLDNDIKITGIFKKTVAINFIGGVKIFRIENNKVYGEISSFKVLNIGVLSIFRKIALKYAVKSFKDKGICYEKGKVIIDIKQLLKDIPFVDLDIEDIYLSNNTINIESKNVNVSVKGELVKELDDNTNEENIIEEKEVMVIEKVEDYYTTGREYAKSKLPIKAKKISDYIFIIPDLIALLYRLLKDSRVPMKTKLIISASVAYIAFPTDIIPDNIPFIGRVDELAVIFFALDKIVNDVPAYVLLENWEGKTDIIIALKSIIEYVTNFTGAKNVEKIYNVIGELTSL